MFHNYAHSFLTQLPHTYYHDGDNTLLEIFYMPPQSEDHALNASFLVSWEFSHPFFTSSLNFLSMTPVHWHSSSTLLPLMEKQSTSSRLLFLLRPQQSHSLAWIYFFLILLLHFFFQVLTFFSIITTCCHLCSGCISSCYSLSLLHQHLTHPYSVCKIWALVHIINIRSHQVVIFTEEENMLL